MRAVGAVVLVVVTSGCGAGPEARGYALELNRPVRIGASFRVRAQTRIESIGALNTREIGLVEARGRVREVTRGQPTKIAFEVFRIRYANRRGSGQRANFAAHFEHGGERSFADASGKPFDPALALALTTLLQPSVDTPGLSRDEIFGTDRPRPVGGIWGGNEAGMTAALADTMRVQTVRGGVQLESVDPCGSTRCFRGSIRVEAEGLARSDATRQRLRSAVVYRLPIDHGRNSSHMDSTLSVRMLGKGNEVSIVHQKRIEVLFDGEPVRFDLPDLPDTDLEPPADSVPGILQLRPEGGCRPPYQPRADTCVHPELLKYETVVDRVIRAFKQGAPAPFIAAPDRSPPN